MFILGGGAKISWLQARNQILVHLHNELPGPSALMASTEGFSGGQKSQWRIAGRLHTFYDAKSYRQVSSLLQRPHCVSIEVSIQNFRHSGKN